MFEVELSFRGDLPHFLRQDIRGSAPIRRILKEKTAVKDVIEACGIPHPEVDLIVLLDSANTPLRALGFESPIDAPANFEIHPVPAPADVLPDSPRLQSRHRDRFVADVHLAALARHLRLLGIDTICESDADDARLLKIMADGDRALLTRDRRLLMHSVVHHGYCPRSDHPEQQAREVLRRFDLRQHVRNPSNWLSRCLRCNGNLQEVPKSDVLSALAAEPRTLRYYDHFLRCADCGRIYWRGSHFDKLTARVARISETTSRPRP